MTEKGKQEEPYITDSQGNKIRVTSMIESYRSRIIALMDENSILVAKLQDLQKDAEKIKELSANKTQSKQK